MRPIIQITVRKPESGLLKKMVGAAVIAGATCMVKRIVHRQTKKLLSDQQKNS
jgi:hypothetical protein